MSALIAIVRRGRIIGVEIHLDEIANQTNTFGSNFVFSGIFYIVWSCLKVVCIIAIISTQFMMRRSEVLFIIQNDKFSISKVFVSKYTATFRYYFELSGWIFRCSLTFTIGNIIFLSKCGGLWCRKYQISALIAWWIDQWHLTANFSLFLPLILVDDQISFYFLVFYHLDNLLKHEK